MLLAPGLKRFLGLTVALFVLGSSGCGIAGIQLTPPATPTVAPAAAQNRGSGPRGEGAQVAGQGGGQRGDGTRGGPPGSPSPGGGGQPGGGPPGGGFGQTFEVAAPIIGVSVDQLRTEVAGTTLTAVAQAHNVDPNSLADALKTSSLAGIDRAVSEGRLQADQVDQMKAGVGDRVSQQLTRQYPPAGQRG